MKFRKYKSIFLVISLISFSVIFAKEEANVKINPHWENYRIEISSNSIIAEESHTFSRNLWKEDSREWVMASVSLFLENFLVDQDTKIKDILKSNRSFAREYSIFLESLRLKKFFIRKGRSFADMLILLRGDRSLLNIMPLPWGDLNYQDLKRPENVGRAYHSKEAKSSFKKRLVPVKYTGLIIDVRGHGFRPSLSPKIFSRSGRLIYGAKFIHPKIGIQRGIVGFMKSLDSTETIRRTGHRPMFLIALGTSGKFNTNAVISYEDQQKFFDHGDSVKNLLKCKVVFIID